MQSQQRLTADVDEVAVVHYQRLEVPKLRKRLALKRFALFRPADVQVRQIEEIVLQRRCRLCQRLQGGYWIVLNNKLFQFRSWRCHVVVKWLDYLVI